MMNKFVSKKDKQVSGSVKLPGSKSISNRALIIQALCEEPFAIRHISEADDTKTLDKYIREPVATVNAGDGGTTMRFLCAYLASQPGEWTLGGSERAHERPIGPLVDALKTLGANIEYINSPGFPPLKIKGGNLYGGTLRLDAGISSQFVSALLLIAPTLPGGLGIILEGDVVSRPYVEMTLKMMEIFGINDWVIRANEMDISEQPYQAKEFSVESDWTAASYFYELAALADDAELLLHGLREQSLQGDQVIAKLMKPFGITSKYTPQGVLISKNSTRPNTFEYDFGDHPDLLQTMLLTCGGAGVPANVSGIASLRYKETDRINALQAELAKFGLSFEEKGEAWTLSGKMKPATTVVNTHADHRMAMAFAPLAILGTQVEIEKAEVVNKSYPGFWRDLSALGLES